MLISLRSWSFRDVNQRNPQFFPLDPKKTKSIAKSLILLLLGQLGHNSDIHQPRPIKFDADPEGVKSTSGAQSLASESRDSAIVLNF